MTAATSTVVPTVASAAREPIERAYAPVVHAAGS